MDGIRRWDPSRPSHEMLETVKQKASSGNELDIDEINKIADEYGTTPAKVRGAIGYYDELRPNQFTVRICTGEACRARGAVELAGRLESEGEVVGELRCTGLCTSGPAVVRDEFPSPISHRGEGLQLFLSADSISVAQGAEEIANYLVLNHADMISLTRTGSRGLYHLEPMLEAEVEGIRHAFGPLTASDIPSVVASLESGSLDSGANYLGKVEELTELSSQQRFATARFGLCCPVDIASQMANGAYKGLERAAELGSAGVISELQLSRLRGRGGAGFPTHFKWASATSEDSEVKYVVANADEGDAGTFIDRMIIEGDPHGLIEGMKICAETIGATEGWVYLRNEYPRAKIVLDEALEQARSAGILGPTFDISIAVGAGSYVCGEETALLESLEGRRGEVRARPPFPTQSGLYGKPTIVNNVLTFALAAAILREGASAWGRLGTERSRGTVVVQASGATERPVCVEVPFGGTIGEVLSEHSSLTGVSAVQIGGPLGSFFTVEEIDDIELSFEGLAEAGGLLGHGGFVMFDSSFDARSESRHLMNFFRDESCGKCTPCRIGTERAVELLARIGADDERDGDRELLASLDDVMTNTSLCALGGLAMNPVRSSMLRWPSSFRGDSHG